MHACNPSTLGGRGRRISEFEASLVYRVSSRTARAIQRNPVSKNKTNKIIIIIIINNNNNKTELRVFGLFSKDTIFHIKSLSLFF